MTSDNHHLSELKRATPARRRADALSLCYACHVGAVGQLLPFSFRPRGRRATRRARCRYATIAHGHIPAASMPQDGAPRRAFLRAHPARAVCSASFCTAFNVCLYSSRVELSAPRVDVGRHGSRDDTPRRPVAHQHATRYELTRGDDKTERFIGAAPAPHFRATR